MVLYSWGMCLGLIGLFRVLLPRERPSVRYLADASYWIYLIHLPLVIGAQIMVRDWALPSGIKFLLTSVGGHRGPADQLPGIRPLHADRHPPERPEAAIGGKTGSGIFRIHVRAVRQSGVDHCRPIRSPPSASHGECQPTSPGDSLAECVAASAMTRIGATTLAVDDSSRRDNHGGGSLDQESD